MGLIITLKNHGPSQVDLPKDISRHDTYKFMMHLLLKNKFTILSCEVIEKLGAKVIPYKRKFFMKQIRIS